MIDIKLLPMRAMVDTNVFMRGLLGSYANEPKAKQCKAFCDAMLDNGKTILVSAPTLAELTRHDGKRIPRMKGVEVIAFDERAAELLGLQLPMAKLNNAKATSGLSLTGIVLIRTLPLFAYQNVGRRHLAAKTKAHEWRVCFCPLDENTANTIALCEELRRRIAVACVDIPNETSSALRAELRRIGLLA